VPTSLQTPQTLPTSYTQPATLGPIQSLEKIVWQNTGGVVVFQVGRLDPSGRPNFDQTEAELPPGIWGMDKIYGIRFRSRDAGTLATIDPVTGYFEDDPDPFNPGNIPGTTTAITGAVNVQDNGSLVGSQPTIDFLDNTGLTWNINNDGPNTRVTIQPQLTGAITVFGRTGNVVAQTGDYTAAQVTNAADKASGATQTFVAGIVASGLTSTGNVIASGNVQADQLVGVTDIQAASGSPSFTPNVNTSSHLIAQHSGLATGVVTINNPGGFPGAGTNSIFSVTISATAGATSGSLWGNAYRFGSITSNIALSVGQSYTWTFVMIGDASRAVCIGSSSGAWT
jgi:hypothetical protein